MKNIYFVEYSIVTAAAAAISNTQSIFEFNMFYFVNVFFIISMRKKKSFFSDSVFGILT